MSAPTYCPLRKWHAHVELLLYVHQSRGNSFKNEKDLRYAMQKKEEKLPTLEKFTRATSVYAKHKGEIMMPPFNGRPC
jgi:hypothetical protein